MPALGTGGINSILGAAFGQTQAIPGTLYVALYTILPTPPVGGGVEVSGDTYARAEISNTSAYFADPLNGSVANNAIIVFPTAAGSWGTIVGVALWMDPVSQNQSQLYVVCNLTVPRTVNPGDTPEIEPGVLIIGGG
jgi:hypothetical protein